MSNEIMIALFLTVIVFVASPGPGIFALLGRALGMGFGPAMALSVGMTLGDLAWMTLAICGLSVFAQTAGGLFFILKLAGGAFLIFMGIKAWTSSVLIEPKAVEGTSGVMRSTLAGFGVAMGNPKSMLFYAAFLPNFIDLSTFDMAAISEAVGIILTASLLVCSVYAAIATRVRHAFQSPATLKAFHRTSGILLVGAGVAVVAK